jgi:hypothetical protein
MPDRDVGPVLPHQSRESSTHAVIGSGDGEAGARLARDRYSWTAIARLTDAVYEPASSVRTAAE